MPRSRTHAIPLLALALVLTLLAPAAPVVAGSETGADRPAPAIALALQAFRDLEAELQTQPRTTYAPGDTLSATFHVFDFGNRRTTGAVVTISPPAAATGLTVTCAPQETDSGSACPTGPLQTTFTIPSIAGSSGVLITVEFVAPVSATGTIDLAVTVAPPAAFEESIAFDNTGTATWTDALAATPVASPAVSVASPVAFPVASPVASGASRDLEAEVDTQPVTTYAPGDLLSATFHVFEFRDESTNDVAMTIIPPTGVSDVTVICEVEMRGDGSECPTGTLGTSFTIPVVGGSRGLLITVEFTAPDSATGPLQLSAEVEPPPGIDERIPGDNTGTVTWTDGSAATTNPIDDSRDLEAEVDAQPETTYAPGDALSATFHVFDFGDDPASGVEVTITPPTGASSVTVTCALEMPSNGSVCPTGDLGTSFTIPTVGGSSGLLLTVQFIAPSGASGSLSLEVSVAPPFGTNERFSSDNTGTATWTPGQAIQTSPDDRDMEVELASQSPGTYQPGDLLLASFHVFEFGDDPVEDAEITISLPTGVTGATVTCVTEGRFDIDASVCPTGDLDSVFTVPAIAGRDGVFITVAFVAPDTATGALEIEVTVAPPSGLDERLPGDNSDTAIWD